MSWQLAQRLAIGAVAQQSMKLSVNRVRNGASRSVQAMKKLGQFPGIKFSADTAERINHRMVSTAAEFLADFPHPEAGSERKLLVATADCIRSD